MYSDLCTLALSHIYYCTLSLFLSTFLPFSFPSSFFSSLSMAFFAVIFFCNIKDVTTIIIDCYCSHSTIYDCDKGDEGIYIIIEEEE